MKRTFIKTLLLVPKVYDKAKKGNCEERQHNFKKATPEETQQVRT